MPLTPSLPTWLAWNNANFTSPTGLTDMASGQQIAAGGLNIGAYFDATNGEAANASYATNGKLYAGRYRLVQVDSGATAANVKTGTIGYLRAGGGAGSVNSVVITNAGTGATAGTYTVAANYGGGGSGAVIQVVVASTGLITSATVLNGGFGYNAVPTFTLTATGTTGGAVAGQLDTSPNVVSSYDQVAANTALAVRPIIFLNAITPGNYGFIQELGTATVLGAASFTGTAAVGGSVQPTTGGLANQPNPTTGINNTTIGLAIDLPVVSNLFKIELGYACSTVQD